MDPEPTLQRVKRHAQRYEAAARKASAAKAERDAVIREAVSVATYETVAKAAGITKDRVNQIVREQRRYATS